MNIKVFSSSVCTLGEGIYFDKVERELYWLDIVESKIYRKKINDLSDEYEVFSIGTMPSTVLSVESGVITFLDKIGICAYDTASNKLFTLYKTPYPDAKGYRGNDATILNDGTALFGTMYRNPNEKKGNLYHLTSHGVFEIEDVYFSIPNTFIELDNAILISDSFEQRIYSVSKNFKSKVIKALWKDYSEEMFTPDGGCVDIYGNIYISMWDGFCVSVFDNTAKQKYKIELPVPRPTNCVLVDERWLYVTTARDGLSEEQIRQYPLSGKVFVIDLEVVNGL
ncbi:SMP-30/gluconolactonase/LRE family protein [Shewanella mangrovisoli]|uniref:SMP-30/gluconolactonase/LRE family protein n=1 Tax=Shewanella mangrovisoli TaxID=2864211 RepID=UPI001C65A0E9|nr:SMP-30/gluconolactonase/LRE family protein [Shewanella mangrovisoli]QYK10444.1 SMP-30/gluconolactonase/LRE family protein [Shewanella mangrovisoli]